MFAPSPAGRLVVLFDRDCGLCLAAARALARWDRRGLLELLPLQEASRDTHPAVREAAAGRRLERELHAVFVAIEGTAASAGPDVTWGTPVTSDIAAGAGPVVAGGDAVLAIVGLLPGGRVPAGILAVPPFRWVVAAGYRAIAANRHRIGRLLRLEGPGCLVDPQVAAPRSGRSGSA